MIDIVSGGGKNYRNDVETCFHSIFSCFRHGDTPKSQENIGGAAPDNVRFGLFSMGVVISGTLLIITVYIKTRK
jgi:hypothetical protein